MKSSHEKVTVVGAGFSGLVTAYYLLQSGFEVEIWEKNPRPGGLIQTLSTPYGLCETAANGILWSKDLQELADAIGLKLVESKKESRKRFIFRGKPKRWPLRFSETLMLVSNLIFRRRRPKKGESVWDWGRSVLGEKPSKYLLAPALQGLYAGDVQRLSATLTLPKKFKKRKMVSPENGMGEMIEKLEQYLLGRGVQIRYEREFKENPQGRTVFAVAAHQVADIAKKLGGTTSLMQIEMVPLVTITAYFNQGLKEDGFGILFPRASGFRTLGILCNHHIFPNRGPLSSETYILGGATDLEAIHLSDEKLLKVILEERSQLLKETSGPPQHFVVTRWPQALPHYTVQWEEALSQNQSFFEEFEKRGVYFIGNYLGSLGLSQILTQAQVLTARLT